MQDLLYNKKTIIGRLKNYFSIYFEKFPVPTADTMFLFVISMIALESVRSVRFLYKHFLAGITEKSLNAFYYACSHAKADCSGFMNVTASLALRLIPGFLNPEPVFLCLDDTMVPKSGKKFEDVSKLFDHAAHNGSNYLNGHCFVSLMICVPLWNNGKIHYHAIPLGYRMWQKDKSKLQLAGDMIRQVMPAISGASQVILLCDSWYAKKEVAGLVTEFPNLDMVCNVRCDSVLYDLPPARTKKRGRPAIRGKHLSLIEDFILSVDKISDYYVGSRQVLTNLFGTLPVTAYVTATDRESDTRRLFLSTIAPTELRMACAWQEKAPLNQSGTSYMEYVPWFLYAFRWNIEVSYYEQKTFWSLCAYMVRSKSGIERMVNLINISYCAMKILPYLDNTFCEYRNKSVQEVRFCFSERIREQVFIATFVHSTENTIKSNAVIKMLKQRIFQKMM